VATILYLDSDETRAQQVRQMFQQRGHSVHFERCAEKAMLAIQHGKRFDVLVLHLFLHGMDGAELCRWLDRNSPLRGIPKVAFTQPGCRLSFDFERGLPHWLPVTQFIGQLQDAAMLVEAVQNLLRQTHQQPGKQPPVREQ